MKARRIPTSTKIAVSLLLTSVTWLYPANLAEENAQTLCSTPAATYRSSEYKVILDPAAKRWMKFQDLNREWKKERGASSSITKALMAPSYQAIIGMGEPAVALILAQLRVEGDDPDQWFWALECITGENPIKPEDQGDSVKDGPSVAGLGYRKQCRVVGRQMIFLSSITRIAEKLALSNADTTVSRGQLETLHASGGLTSLSRGTGQMELCARRQSLLLYRHTKHLAINFALMGG